MRPGNADGNSNGGDDNDNDKNVGDNDDVDNNRYLVDIVKLTQHFSGAGGGARRWAEGYISLSGKISPPVREKFTICRGITLTIKHLYIVRTMITRYGFNQGR